MNIQYPSLYIVSLLGPHAQELLGHGVDGVRLLLLHPVRRSLQQPQRVVRHVLARPREGALYEGTDYKKK